MLLCYFFYFLFFSVLLPTHVCKLMVRTYLIFIMPNDTGIKADWEGWMISGRWFLTQKLQLRLWARRSTAGDAAQLDELLPFSLWCRSLASGSASPWPWRAIQHWRTGMSASWRRALVGRTRQDPEALPTRAHFSRELFLCLFARAAFQKTREHRLKLQPWNSTSVSSEPCGSAHTSPIRPMGSSVPKQSNEALDFQAR